MAMAMHADRSISSCAKQGAGGSALTLSPPPCVLNVCVRLPKVWVSVWVSGKHVVEDPRSHSQARGRPPQHAQHSGTLACTAAHGPGQGRAWRRRRSHPAWGSRGRLTRPSCPHPARGVLGGLKSAGGPRAHLAASPSMRNRRLR